MREDDVILKKLILNFDINLYYLKRYDFVSYLEKGLCNIEFVSITEELLNDNKNLFSKKYRLWKRNFKKGAVGLFALAGGK